MLPTHCFFHCEITDGLSNAHWERTKRVRQEEMQEEAGDWDRKGDRGKERRQLHERGEAYDKNCNMRETRRYREKESETNIKRHMEREEWEDRKGAQQSGICSYSMDVFAWFRGTAAWCYDDTNTSNKCWHVFFPSTHINEGGPYVPHMPPTESFNTQTVCGYRTQSWLILSLHLKYSS